MAAAEHKRKEEQQQTRLTCGASVCGVGWWWCAMSLSNLGHVKYRFVSSLLPCCLYLLCVTFDYYYGRKVVLVADLILLVLGTILLAYQG